jgi:uncharacterized coiled-coil protein SlyX
MYLWACGNLLVSTTVKFKYQVVYKFYQGMRWPDLEESDVGGVGEAGGAVAAGSRVRASIRLSPEAAVVWSSLDKPSRVRLGALFNELIVWYGRTRRLPLPPITMLLEASELLTKGFEACKEQLAATEREVERLARELEEVKARLRDQQELESKLREAEQTIASLRNALSIAEAKIEQYKDKLNHYRNWESRLAQILCPHLEDLKTLAAGDKRAVVELEALCWPKRDRG